MPPEDGQPSISLGRKLSEIVNHGDNDPNELIKHRFLCRGGVMSIIAQTGMGKSSLSMQMMIQFAIEQPAFCFIPKAPLKSLLLQAENDDGDTAEMRDGVFAGYKLTEIQIHQACENIILPAGEIPSGEMFFPFLEEYLKAHKPDLVWIDPVLAFLGGDTSSQKDVSIFLRNKLQPLLRQYNCGCIIVHHTNKVITSVDAYAGSGSAEYGNMSRAVLLLMSKGKGRFELKAVKRGWRLHLKMPNGITYTDSIFIRHSSVDGQIFWENADDAESETTDSLNKVQSQEQTVLSYVPENDTIDKTLLAVTVNAKADIGINKVKMLIKGLINSRILFESKVPRTDGPPEVRVSRHPPANADTVKQQ